MPQNRGNGTTKAPTRRRTATKKAARKSARANATKKTVAQVAKKAAGVTPRAATGPSQRTSRDQAGPFARLGRQDGIAQVRQAATMLRATDRLRRILERKMAHRLDEHGHSQREIADALGTNQPAVHRMLKIPTKSSIETPEEIILRATVTGSDRDELVRNLAKYPYTFGAVAPYPFEGTTPGTWDQIETAALMGYLSTSEFERICAAVEPPSTAG
ncbi:hypothetical protein CGZ93_08450 [Enemella dayhoffiae]|uniref:Helix-turn-helix domain-containing protein n=1 Tax=Enemella dayhoffiae TaxID=2016507 RepID=A0A255H433_9ACTN|nr:hypothetical protein [Enemella dayhoffiae]OYO21956.1 hypothetical protein CGZ93_08450 [Enemella dayhoffiae]